MQHTTRLRRRLAIAAPLALLASACGDAAAPPTPDRLVAVSPASRVAAPSDSAADTLIVRVEDRRGRGVPDIPVHWQVEGGGAVSSSGSASDAAGLVRTVWVRGTAAGLQRVLARSDGLDPVEFVAMVEAGPPARMLVVGGDGQRGEVGLPLVEPLAVRVEDAWGNPVPAAEARWEAQAGAVSPTAGRTDAEGRAAATWTLGPLAGPQALDVRVGSLPPTRFAAEAEPGPAAALRLLPDSAVVGASQVLWLELSAEDRFGNPAGPENVTWSAEPASALVVLEPGVVRALAPGEGRVRAAAGSAMAEAPVRVREAAAPLSAGFTHTCALSDGRAHCWGGNRQGELGLGAADTAAHPSPAPVGGAPPFRVVSAGFHHTCALEEGGTAWCWGSNEWRQLGIADRDTVPAPAPVAAAPAFRTIVAAAGPFTCGLAMGGDAWCWGANHFGQLGDGTLQDRGAPTAVATASAFVELVAGAAHACGLTAAGEALCWGANFSGQLGTGDTVDARAPRPVADGHRFATLAAGAWHTCGVTLARGALCWGEDPSGQAGAGSPAGVRVSPVPVAGDHAWTFARGGERHTCALAVGGAASCWGSRGVGALGDGGGADAASPRPVSGGLLFASLATGGWHTCAATAEGAAWCWGWNLSGQLGDATTTNRAVPTAVPGLRVDSQPGTAAPTNRR